MEKKDLKATKDSQGYYEVTEGGRIVWDGFALSANNAKNQAIEFYNDNAFRNEDY